MAKARIIFIERKFWSKDVAAFSIEKIFEQVGKLLSRERFSPSSVRLPFGNSPADILKNLVFFRKPDADVYHVTGHVHYIVLLLPPEKTVLTIHDTGFLEVRPGLKRWVLKKLFLDLPVKRLNYITAVSQATKNSILTYTGSPPEKVRVIENPVQEHYLNGSVRPFNKEVPTVLQIGTTANKNIPLLIDALSAIRCRLKIVGRLTPEILDKLRTSSVEYDNAFDLTDLEMKREYEDADIVAFCSTFEGFGMPIIEAQSMGRPVITSDMSPMKEVAGGGAHLADPNSAESIRQGIVKIISDDEYRAGLIERGRENAKRFDPQSVTDRYAELYDEVLRRNTVRRADEQQNA